MNIRDFRIRFFIFSFTAFGILAGIAGYAVWLDRSLLQNLLGQIMLGAAPAAWLLFFLTGTAMLPSGLDEGGNAAAGIRKKLFRMRLLVLSFLFFSIVYTAFGTALHNHIIIKGEEWLKQAMLYGPPAVWLLFFLAGGTLTPAPAPRGTVPEQEPEPVPVAEEALIEKPAEEESAPPAYVQEEQCPDEQEIKEAAVVQVIGLFQREGRLIDFLQEDIEPYEDAQIGAAVREVHRGCRKVLSDSLGLAPVLEAEEGTRVDIDEDFDPAKIKLVGNVHGDPPFTGVLRHCGWRVADLKLPVRTGTVDNSVIAPAEVEI